MGGAFVAVADDPTALHFNPAGIALLPRSSILLGGELVIAPRRYTPVFADDRCDADPVPEICEPQEPDTAPIPLPVLGFAGRLTDEGLPSRVAFGIGVWNTFGGQLEYPPFENEELAAIVSTRNAVIEIVPGVAYEVNDVLAVGAAFRVGVGLFDTTTQAKPVNSELHTRGVGIGATLGAMLRLPASLQLGLVYRTALTVRTTGDGEIDPPPVGDPILLEVEVLQEWPQTAGAGLAWRGSGALRGLLLAAELDWADWSRLNDLRVEFPGEDSLNQRFLLDWDDSYSVHAGAEYAFNSAVAARAGWSYDTNAVPDATIERQFLDGEKFSYSVGASVEVRRGWRIDTAFEWLPGKVRTVPDNSDELDAWRYPLNTSPATRANSAPGEHVGDLYTIELSLAYLY
jgi:long-chain fatty acid transport protein